MLSVECSFIYSFIPLIIPIWPHTYVCMCAFTVYTWSIKKKRQHNFIFEMELIKESMAQRRHQHICLLYKQLYLAEQKKRQWKMHVYNCTNSIYCHLSLPLGSRCFSVFYCYTSIVAISQLSKDKDICKWALRRMHGSVNKIDKQSLFCAWAFRSFRCCCCRFKWSKKVKYSQATWRVSTGGAGSGTTLTGSHLIISHGHLMLYNEIVGDDEENRQTK